MKTMIIMMGIQGSGKSEFYKQQLSAHYVRVNLDTLKTRNNERRLIDDCLSRSVSFAIDNTNPTAAVRAAYIDLAKKNGYKVVGYFMQSRLKECIERNNLREGKAKIPPKAIAATSNMLELPSRNEGFDELYFVANDGKNMTISDWRDDDEL